MQIQPNQLSKNSASAPLTCEWQFRPAPDKFTIPPPIEFSQHTEDRELQNFIYRFKLSLAFTLSIFLISIRHLFPGLPLPQLIDQQALNYLQFLLACPVVLWLAQPFFERSYESFKTGYLTAYSLIGLGVTTAYGYSVVAIIFSNWLPDEFKFMGTVPLYFEAAAVIVTMVLLGQILELRGRTSTHDALRSLLSLPPKTAIRLVKNCPDEVIRLDQVRPHDSLRVRPGTRVPVDGIITSGTSWIDEAILTGEATPKEKTIGSLVCAGTVNLSGGFIMLAQKIGADTMLANIFQLVSQACHSRVNIEQLADRVTRWFVPFVFICASASAVAWILTDASTSFAMMCATSVLLIACPCTLGLAAPISFTVAVGRAATAGIVIKDAKSLELMAKVTTLVIDKTGTLTESQPQIEQFQTFHHHTYEDVLRYAAALEQYSKHPLAYAIVQAANEEKLDFPDISEFHAFAGLGVRGRSDDLDLLLGSPQFLIQQHCLPYDVNQIQVQTNTSIVCLAINKQLAGVFELSDQLKSNAVQTLEPLRQAGLEIILLTGDNELKTSPIAKQCHIDQVYADLLPADKHHCIQMLQQQGKIVAMAGDGINDAPAIALAQVGIAMGNGSDIAMQSADIILLKGNLSDILAVRKLSLATMKNIRQNLFFAFMYNFCGIPIAAGLLYPCFGILLNPMLAVAAMALSSVTVLFNALRLRRIQLSLS